ncbi:uncharacterized protein LOC133782928 isoform X3 [Humulus lupulus]|uniref:uncharacterized protein LOC133782928 isoform X3 n=1 Tax=Humulus lupulus TaxID=3486 RepID=UPI002B40492F|nr:uncharacterized protein LOC133782928 isoform X3 [Humulus lupulus]
MSWEKKILLLGETKWCRREASAVVGVASMSPEGEKYCCCYYARLLRWEPHIRVPWRSWAYLAASFLLVVIDGDMNA